MPREEITNSRPNNYGVFRRKCIREDILKYCYMVDGDWFEIRFIDGKLRVVAYVETIQIPNDKTYLDYPVWEAKRFLAEEISKGMGIPAFIVWNTKDCKIFFVNEIGKDKTVKLSNLGYTQWIRKLGCDL